MNRRGLQRHLGFTLVELMVGMVISLIVISGALKLTADFFAGHARLVMNTALQQDLRVAADIVARDLRRAGFWRGAGTAGDAVANDGISLSEVASFAQVSYAYTNDAAVSDTDTSSKVAFRINAETLQMREGNSSWQEITDPNRVRVTRFTITPTIQEISLGHLCVPVCTNTSPDCPRVHQRTYAIAIAARSANSTSAEREIRESVRVRNDEITPRACP